MVVIASRVREGTTSPQVPPDHLSVSKVGVGLHYPGGECRETVTSGVREFVIGRLQS